MNKKKPNHITVRIWKETRDRLKIKAIKKGLTLVAYLDEIARQ